MYGYRKKRDRESGAAAVEFALVMLPIVVLMFGLVQYGFYFWAMQGGSDIARSAARLSSVGRPATCAEFQTAVTAQINDLVGSGMTSSVQRSYEQQTPAEVQVGDVVSVVVRFRSPDMHFPFIPFINDGIVTARAESRVDYVPSQPESCT
jgi:Flp pilus assembly protein TadG